MYWHCKVQRSTSGNTSGVIHQSGYSVWPRIEMQIFTLLLRTATAQSLLLVGNEVD